MPDRLKVSIVGAGYVGLVSGVCLAEMGHEVTCVDLDPVRVEQINGARSPIWEPGLDELLGRNCGKGVQASTDLKDAVLSTDITFVAVGTPFDGQEIDLSQVLTCVETIAKILADKESFHLVVVKSTVVPGTTEKDLLPLLEKVSGKRAGEDFGVAMNPEFLREGCAVSDFLEPDRIVIGILDERSQKLLEKLYAPFNCRDLVVTTPSSAEMIKYTANSLLATLISFSNEIANLCSAMGGVDAEEVMRGVHLDHRISPISSDGSRVSPGLVSYLKAGPGFGGSCFPKDVKAFVSHGASMGYEPRLLSEVVRINESQPFRVKDLLVKNLGELEDKCVALLGVAFKPNTDDVRESPSLKLASALVSMGCRLRVYDPVAKLPSELAMASEVEISTSLEDALIGVDAVIVMTQWDVFRDLPRLFEKVSSQPLLIDARRMFDKDDFDNYGGIGL